MHLTRRKEKGATSARRRRNLAWSPERFWFLWLSPLLSLSFSLYTGISNYFNSYVAGFGFLFPRVFFLKSSIIHIEYKALMYIFSLLLCGLFRIFQIKAKLEVLVQLLISCFRSEKWQQHQVLPFLFHLPPSEQTKSRTSATLFAAVPKALVGSAALRPAQSKL